MKFPTRNRTTAFSFSEHPDGTCDLGDGNMAKPNNPENVQNYNSDLTDSDSKKLLIDTSTENENDDNDINQEILSSSDVVSDEDMLLDLRASGSNNNETDNVMAVKTSHPTERYTCISTFNKGLEHYIITS